MEVNNLKLLSEIQKRRALWTKSKDYNELQWQEVANAMNDSVFQCKNRFRVLRNIYRSEVRSLQQKKTFKSNWPYFDAMEFLRSMVDPNNLVPFPPQPFGININEVLVIETPSQNAVQQYDLSFAANNDVDANFLLGILQDIKHFSNEKKSKFRTEVNRILMDLNHEGH